MDKKLILIVSSVLLIGLFVGVILGYFVASSTENLQNQIDDLQNQITQKDSQIQALQKQVNDLESFLGPIRKGEWNLIQTFEGSDVYPMEFLVTDYFYISATELRINWTYTPKLKELSSVIRVDFYVKGDSLPAEMVLMSKNNGTTFVHNIEPAYYYVEITLGNLEQWKIAIEAWIAE